MTGQGAARRRGRRSSRAGGRGGSGPGGRGRPGRTRPRAAKEEITSAAWPPVRPTSMSMPLAAACSRAVAASCLEEASFSRFTSSTSPIVAAYAGSGPSIASAVNSACVSAASSSAFSNAGSSASEPSIATRMRSNGIRTPSPADAAVGSAPASGMSARSARGWKKRWAIAVGMIAEGRRRRQQRELRAVDDARVEPVERRDRSECQARRHQQRRERRVRRACSGGRAGRRRRASAPSSRRTAARARRGSPRARRAETFMPPLRKKNGVRKAKATTRIRSCSWRCVT